MPAVLQQLPDVIGKAKFQRARGLRGSSPCQNLEHYLGPSQITKGWHSGEYLHGKGCKRVSWVSRGMHLVDCYSHRVYIGFLRTYALVQTRPGRHKDLWCHERSRPTTLKLLRRLHFEAWVKHNGREPKVYEACGDGVGILDKYIGLNDMRGGCGVPMGALTPFKSPCTILAL